MKIRTRINFALFAILIVSALGCATSSTATYAMAEKFDVIKIGDPARKVSQIWGDPAENTERFQNVEYRILQYSDENGVPVAMFALDPQSQLVAGKAKWVSAQDQESDFENILKSKFSGISFKTYIPCETRSPKDEILVSRERGLFLFRRMERLLLISWADPTLTSLRIEQFYKKCSKLQTEKR
jgi:hypothetical protein